MVCIVLISYYKCYLSRKRFSQTKADISISVLSRSDQHTRCWRWQIGWRLMRIGYGRRTSMIWSTPFRLRRLYARSRSVRGQASCGWLDLGTGSWTTGTRTGQIREISCRRRGLLRQSITLCVRWRWNRLTSVKLRRSWRIRYNPTGKTCQGNKIHTKRSDMNSVRNRNSLRFVIVVHIVNMQMMHITMKYKMCVHQYTSITNSLLELPPLTSAALETAVFFFYSIAVREQSLGNRYHVIKWAKGFLNLSNFPVVGWEHFVYQGQVACVKL